MHESELLYQSFSELPRDRRYNVMLLIPFLDDPMAKLIMLRQLSRSRKAYNIITTHPNASEIIHDLYDKSLKWIQHKPTEFAFPVVQIENQKFTLPDAKFSEVTFGQLVELDSLFTRYLKSQREHLLDSFLQTLYTIHNSPLTINHSQLTILPYPYKLDAFRMYCVLREKIFSSFSNLFPPPTVSKKDPAKPLDFRKIQDSTPMWHSVLFSLAESPAYQGMHIAKAANMWEALTYLDEKAFQAKKERENNENRLQT
jgi:hypothetical protein